MRPNTRCQRAPVFAAGPVSTQSASMPLDEGGDPGADLLPECTESSQCVLHADCCNCVALTPDQDPPGCDINSCKQDACTQLAIDPQADAQCQAGRCIPGANCDHSQVKCLTAPPVCPAGEIPSVQNACWGPCVRSSECSFVPDCTSCDATHFVCVSNIARVPTHHCVDLPKQCASDRSCACLGESVCISPYVLCADSAATNQIDCECPNC